MIPLNLSFFKNIISYEGEYYEIYKKISLMLIGVILLTTTPTFAAELQSKDVNFNVGKFYDIKINSVEELTDYVKSNNKNKKNTLL